jgi:hypothetical protein
MFPVETKNPYNFRNYWPPQPELRDMFFNNMGETFINRRCSAVEDGCLENLK